MAFSILEFLGLKKKRTPLTEEQIAQRKARLESDSDPVGGDMEDGFGDGDGGGEGGGDGE